MIEEESNDTISCLMSLRLQDQGASNDAVFRREAWNDPDPPMRMTIWVLDTCCAAACSLPMLEASGLTASKAVGNWLRENGEVNASVRNLRE